MRYNKFDLGQAGIDAASTAANSIVPGSGDFVAQVGAAVQSLFKSVFGGGYQNSSGVRWLAAYYDYYVNGNAASTSDNKVDEKISPDAQAWFSAVLGVPIYDRYRLHALMGTNPADGSSLNRSDSQKVQDYLSFPDTAGVNPANVASAVQMAKHFTWGSNPGSWAQVAKLVPGMTNTGGGGGANVTGPGLQGTNTVDQTAPGSGAPPVKKSNIWLWVGIGAGLIILTVTIILIAKKKKS